MLIIGKPNTRYPLLFLMLCGLVGCAPMTSQNTGHSIAENFQEYWYAGQAELTRYKLEQARYGEIHEGDAVLIFVTEDFLRDKQVKYEGGPRDNNVVPILKLNATRKFYTGIYPYSMMSSIFTPVVPQAKTLKVTTTSQEWCGHTFSQLNLRGNKYRGQLYSYFMDEGDREFSVEAVLLEDEIWNRIRLNPDALPTGNIEIVPGSMYARLKHQETNMQRAIATKTSMTNADLSSHSLISYKIDYQDLNRELTIIFESVFPYAIVAWEEQVESGFGAGKKTLTTKAVRTHTMNSAYWSQHDVADAPLRRELGLE